MPFKSECVAVEELQSQHFVLRAMELNGDG
jgi:hypothetical protein